MPLNQMLHLCVFVFAYSYHISASIVIFHIKTVIIVNTMNKQNIFVVILESRQFVVVQNADWIQNKNFGIKTKVFFSPKENSKANFNAQQKYLLDKRTTAT